MTIKEKILRTLCIILFVAATALGWKVLKEFKEDLKKIDLMNTENLKEVLWHTALAIYGGFLYVKCKFKRHHCMISTYML